MLIIIIFYPPQQSQQEPVPFPQLLPLQESLPQPQPLPQPLQISQPHPREEIRRGQGYGQIPLQVQVTFQVSFKVQVTCPRSEQAVSFALPLPFTLPFPVCLSRKQALSQRHLSAVTDWELLTIDVVAWGFFFLMKGEGFAFYIGLYWNTIFTYATNSSVIVAILQLVPSGLPHFWFHPIPCGTSLWKCFSCHASFWRGGVAVITFLQEHWIRCLVTLHSLTWYVCKLQASQFELF